MNGLSDLNRREIRALHAFSFYDEPIRLFRLERLRLRLGYEVDEKTRLQYAAAREAGAEQQIPRRELCEELKRIADEPSPAEVIRTLDSNGLLTIFSAALSGPKLNLAGLIKLERARRIPPPDVTFADQSWGPFINVLTERLSSKEKAALLKHVEMKKPEVEAWQKLPARSRRLEGALKSARLKKPSQIYTLLSQAPGAEILFLLYRSNVRLVQDRIKNYLTKYLPTALEVTDAEIAAGGLKPGTPKFTKAKTDLIAARLDGRARKPTPPPAPEPPPPEPARGRRMARVS